MKSIVVYFHLAVLSAISFQAHALADFCPDGIASGEEGCYQVEAVYFLEEWVRACCSNIEVPEGYSCVWDDCNAKKGNSANQLPALAKGNAYIKFQQGYRTWTIVDGEANPDIPKFHLGDMRGLLPFARLMFLNNEDLKMFSLEYSENIKIVIQRPELDEELIEEIKFPDPLPAKKEIQDFIYERNDKSLKLYPNPILDMSIMEFENGLPIFKVQVFSQEAEILKSYEYEGGVKVIEIPSKDLAPGIYIFRITDIYGNEYEREVVKI